MKPMHGIALLIAIAAITAVALIAAARGGEKSSLAAPVFGVTLPDGYADWPLIAPAQEAAPLQRTARGRRQCSGDPRIPRQPASFP